MIATPTQLSAIDFQLACVFNHHNFRLAYFAIFGHYIKSKI